MDRICIPVRVINRANWGALSFVSPGSHDICAYNVKLLNEQLTLAGNHRVRVYRFKDNVHWKIPADAQLIDISGVTPAAAPRRRGR